LLTTIFIDGAVTTELVLSFSASDLSI